MITRLPTSARCVLIVVYVAAAFVALRWIEVIENPLWWELRFDREIKELSQ
jgi:predicted small integral membrane protein